MCCAWACMCVLIKRRAGFDVHEIIVYSISVKRRKKEKKFPHSQKIHGCTRRKENPVILIHIALHGGELQQYAAIANEERRPSSTRKLCACSVSQISIQYRALASMPVYLVQSLVKYSGSYLIMC